MSESLKTLFITEVHQNKTTKDHFIKGFFEECGEELIFINVRTGEFRTKHDSEAGKSLLTTEKRNEEYVLSQRLALKAAQANINDSVKAHIETETNGQTGSMTYSLKSIIGQNQYDTSD